MSENHAHKFGGKWTQEKLSILKEYLASYMEIFTKSERARHLIPHYIDAFAGTGHWTAKRNPSAERQGLNLLAGMDDAISFQEGSVKMALDQNPPFQKYIFIDIDPKHIKELHRIKDNYPNLKERIHIDQAEANEFIKTWCSKIRQLDRAVLFLDPYGASIEWETLKAIANTKSIDLWFLFPLGSAVNRLLPKNKYPNDAFSQKLTKIFGTDEWMNFYIEKKERQRMLPGLQDSFTKKKYIKTVDFENIGNFFVQRLDSIFEGVATPRPLYNSKKNPLYLLCFAVGNPKGKEPALKIANHLLQRI